MGHGGAGVPATWGSNIVTERLRAGRMDARAQAMDAAGTDVVALGTANAGSGTVAQEKRSSWGPPRLPPFRLAFQLASTYTRSPNASRYRPPPRMTTAKRGKHTHHFRVLKEILPAGR